MILQEISFGCHLVQVRNVLKQMLFSMPRTDDPSVFGGGTEHYFSGWQLGGLQELYMACNLDIRVLSNDAERSMISIFCTRTNNHTFVDAGYHSSPGIAHRLVCMIWASCGLAVV